MSQIIKTRGGWVAEVNLIHESICEKAHASMKEPEVLIKFQQTKEVNKLHVKLGSLG